jgi:DNA polymerase III subunit delta'
LRAGRSAHAYLLTGPRGIGKAAVAVEFARLLLCEDDDALSPCEICPQCLLSRSLHHPDLHLVFPLPTKKSGSAEDDDREFASVIAAHVATLAADLYASPLPPKAKEIRIGAVRSLLHRAAMKPFQAARKVFVILSADTMNDAAQNALLKALEEPADDAAFVLVTENEGALLPTIRSRCQRVRMNRLARSAIAEALVASGVEAEAAKIAAALAGGSYAHARELAAGGVQDLQNRVIAFLRAAAMCDPLELTDASAKLMETGALPEHSGLELLSIFLRDVALWHASQNGSDRLPFRDFQTHIVRLLSSYPHADFEAAVHAVDESAQHLTKGYTQEFVLYALAIRLHDALGERATAKPSPQRAEHV